jgi:DNA-binding CsgD family transcriptional regulator
VLSGCGCARCGKSSTDTVQIMGVSRRIVARDLESVRAKLGVRSIGQAIALFAAYEAGILPSNH